MARFKKIITIPFAVIILIIIFPFLYSLIHPWTNIQCRKDYIDINSGISRIKKYYWFIKYSDKTRPTYLSELLGIDSAQNPLWNKVNTFSFGHGHSPHYKFHSSFYQIKKLEIIISLHNINQTDSKEIAYQIIKLWNESKSDNKANEYLDQIDSQHMLDLNK